MRAEVADTTPSNNVVTTEGVVVVRPIYGNFGQSLYPDGEKHRPEMWYLNMALTGSIDTKFVLIP